jgi:hypothetical protein
MESIEMREQTQYYSNNFVQVVPGSARPLESDIRVLAHIFWEDLGKPTGIDLNIWLAAENALIKIHNDPNLTEYMLKLTINLRQRDGRSW